LKGQENQVGNLCSAIPRSNRFNEGKKTGSHGWERKKRRALVCVEGAGGEKGLKSSAVHGKTRERILDRRGGGGKSRRGGSPKRGGRTRVSSLKLAGNSATRRGKKKKKKQRFQHQSGKGGRGKKAFRPSKEGGGPPGLFEKCGGH